VAGEGIFRSADGGNTWKNTGTPPGVLPVVTDLLVDPTNAHVLHVRTESVIYRSSDSGASWQVSRSGPASSLVMAPDQPDVLYAGVPGTGVVRTRDGGRSGDAGWSTLTPASAADVSTYRLASRQPTHGPSIRGFGVARVMRSTRRPTVASPGGCGRPRRSTSRSSQRMTAARPACSWVGWTSIVRTMAGRRGH
jgi:hypothetical protein